MIPLEEMGKFKVVVVDPPWSIPLGPRLRKPKPGRRGGYSTETPYSVMSLDDICKLPIPEVLADDSTLFCWTVNSHLRDCFTVLDNWGVRYFATMTWVKNWGPQFPGGPMYNSEWIVVGKKGTSRFRDTRRFFLANKWDKMEPRTHSQKPHQFYDLLNRVTEGPRLDVFGRRRIPGFTSWGDQAPTGPPLPEIYQQVMF